jgi:hypothetical protein
MGANNRIYSHQKKTRHCVFFLLKKKLFSYTFGMKLFSAFNSNYKQEELAAAQKEFGDEKVMLVEKSILHYFIGFFLPMVVV